MEQTILNKANSVFDRYSNLPITPKLKTAFAKVNTEISNEGLKAILVDSIGFIEQFKEQQTNELRDLDMKFRLVSKYLNFQTEQDFLKAIIEEQKTHWLRTNEGESVRYRNVEKITGLWQFEIYTRQQLSNTNKIQPEYELPLYYLSFFSGSCLEPKHVLSDKAYFNVSSGYLNKFKNVLKQSNLSFSEDIIPKVQENTLAFSQSLINTLVRLEVYDESDRQWVTPEFHLTKEDFNPKIEVETVEKKAIWKNVFVAVFNNIRTPFMFMFSISFVLMFLFGISLYSKVPSLLQEYPLVKLSVILLLIFFLTHVGLETFNKMKAERKRMNDDAAVKIREKIIKSLTDTSDFIGAIKEQWQHYENTVKNKVSEKFRLYKFKVEPVLKTKAKNIQDKSLKCNGYITNSDNFLRELSQIANTI
jgi:hypothetical protein